MALVMFCWRSTRHYWIQQHELWPAPESLTTSPFTGTAQPPLALHPAPNTVQAFMIVFKCFHGLASSYLADNCILVSTVAGQHRLHSANNMKLSVQRTRTVISRAIALSVAVTRNNLPTELRLASFILTFAWKLETFYTSLMM